MKTPILLAACLPLAAGAASLLEEVGAADRAADAAVAAVGTPKDLAAKQSAWRAAWLEGLGGLPERTPLNAQEGPVAKCDGFTFQNVLFESQPGVYVVGHLLLPDSPAFKPPYPAVLLPMGHSDNGILNPRYAAQCAGMARAGFAAFAWDPISQGERRQCSAAFDHRFYNCADEHARLGFRGWLVGWNFARFRLWDGIRALDWLETRKDVDCSRVGVAGTSGGGTMSAYLQALEPRIRVGFPNCYVSSIRAVFSARGCHDAEQFFWNQLNVGVNHAAMLALGLGRVDLATGSRWEDYFPHSGAVETFAVYSNLWTRCGAVRSTAPAGGTTPWHFHCAGPHGLPAPTRAAQRDWMLHCIKGGPRPQPPERYWNVPDETKGNCLPFPSNVAFFTASHNVRDLKGFRSVYGLIADEAQRLARERKPKSRGELRAIVRRRANIRKLEDLCGTFGIRALVGGASDAFGDRVLPAFDHPTFNWWYLGGAYGYKRENEAAMMATLGRSAVGRDAERIILNAVGEILRAHPDTTVAQLKSLVPWRAVPLKASGWNCIAAAHAYAAEPQLFSKVEFAKAPPSWTEMVENPNPKTDSFAIAVWGALKDYDWPDLIAR